MFYYCNVTIVGCRRQCRYTWTSWFAWHERTTWQRWRTRSTWRRWKGRTFLIPFLSVFISVLQHFIILHQGQTGMRGSAGSKGDDGFQVSIDAETQIVLNFDTSIIAGDLFRVCKDYQDLVGISESPA